MTERCPLLYGEVLFDCFEDGSRVLGGAPINVAWHLHAFGLAPLLISRLGRDAGGQEVLAAMEAWGMSTAGMQEDADHGTGEVRVGLIDGQPGFDIMAERAWDFIDGEQIPPVSPSLIYHGSLALRHPVAAASLARLQQSSPAPLFLDVNLRDPWWQREQVRALMGQARWLKINDQELEALVEAHGQDLEAKAAALLEHEALSLVVVTCGAEGAFALDDQGQLERVHPTSSVPVVDTVGAGDAFAAVCICGLLRHWPLSDTLRRAQDFAVEVVKQRGATLQDPAIYQQCRLDWGM
jgi:fructokinase